MRTCWLTLLLASLCAGAAFAQIQVRTTQGEETDLAHPPSFNDLIQGKIATELPGDMGWHPVNTDPRDQLAAFTDGILERALFTGLLNDFPGAGNPAKRIQYDLGGPKRIDEIRVFSGNIDRNGRVFHTYTVFFSQDGGETFDFIAYVQSHPSGTLNNENHNRWRFAMTQLYNLEGPLGTGVTHIRFHFYAVDNLGGQMRDPYDGVNPFTGVNDGLTAAFVSPKILEIDVVPEPASIGVLGFGVVALWLRRRLVRS